MHPCLTIAFLVPYFGRIFGRSWYPYFPSQSLKQAGCSLWQAPGLLIHYRGPASISKFPSRKEWCKLDCRGGVASKSWRRNQDKPTQQFGNGGGCRAISSPCLGVSDKWIKFLQVPCFQEAYYLRMDSLCIQKSYEKMKESPPQIGHQGFGIRKRGMLMESAFAHGRFDIRRGSTEDQRGGAECGNLSVRICSVRHVDQDPVKSFTLEPPGSRVVSSILTQS